MNVEKIIKTKKEIPLEARTIIHLTLVTNKINEMMSASLKPFGISIQQFNVLRILRGQENKPANLSTINERMVTKMSNTTRLVDKLLAKDYVIRKICPQNRRKVEIKITTKGLDVLNEIDGIKFEMEKDILKNFSTTELKELNSLLDKF
ncbi:MULTISPECIES: MarR family winged helix-turn-helix transcriptional regulator [Maribacter]|uniref:MarR family transcriptional regulator n=2 Tax=Maribacter TaxID=252356 RepID=A0A5B2TNI6_9FLAO|nr:MULTISPECIES: MarR family transcriptional regulator [Maribacter]KAA2216027.1 MarR family transcriptional regulator [Maribacter flavus]MDC6406874.1 MarR family transcriptional regulator [Maribacter sp. PR66]MEE1973992.1 MarR family transcriptional regulator [Maribacter flavus]TLF41612.1 MarR family transcriptional regulator [Maribacter aurantiacus]